MPIERWQFHNPATNERPTSPDYNTIIRRAQIAANTTRQPITIIAIKQSGAHATCHICNPDPTPPDTPAHDPTTHRPTPPLSTR